MSLVHELDKLLPQTQCRECGYAGCMPYAEALACGQASIDRCPPGGVKTVRALGQLLKIDTEPYLAEAQQKTRAPAVARIKETECIGCTKCIQACPVDAIIGSAKQMHAIISHECTGCGLCLDPCPVDCIELHPLAEPVYDKNLVRERHHARQIRLLKEAREKEQNYQQKRLLAKSTKHQAEDKEAKQAYILQALARVQSKNDNE